MIDHFSGTLALFAFATVTIIGLIKGDGLSEVLQEALVGMAVFLVLGKVLSYIGRRMIAEGFEESKPVEITKDKKESTEVKDTTQKASV